MPTRWHAYRGGLRQYIDDVEFRQAIEKQLNKSESSNKFSQPVAFGNNQEFLHGEKAEQEIAESCRRLIKNAIVCWKNICTSRLQRIWGSLHNPRKRVIAALSRWLCPLSGLSYAATVRFAGRDGGTVTFPFPTVFGKVFDAECSIPRCLIKS